MSIGFDSKDFKRAKLVGEKKEILFYSPLGIGVKVDDRESLRERISDKTNEFNKSFKNPRPKAIHCSSSLVHDLGHRKATPFIDNLVKSLEDLIDSVFISYIILPPKDIPEIQVGGLNCPRQKIRTMNFLRTVATQFSYITAWSYCGRHKETNELHIDSFSGKETTAWEDLRAHDFNVVPRGDECNELICLADLVAYLTDKKLWDNKKWLEPHSLEEVWESYDFQVETRFLDKNVLSKIQWFSDNQINFEQYLVHPLVFLYLDEINMKKFIGSTSYCDMASYAFRKKGGIQGYDPNLDFNKITNGDIFVYAGKNAQSHAEMLNDMFDIEIYTVKELRQKK